MNCPICDFPVENAVYCKCGMTFCRTCFGSHECNGSEHARYAGGASTTIDPQVLLSALPPRPYQSECIESIHNNLEENGRTLAVLATGLGKTVIMGHVARTWGRGRVLVMAHRDELIQQAADKIGRIVNEPCDVEMADLYADRCSLHQRAHVVVTSVQTMCRERRQQRFDPNDFGLLMIDEAHHATASTYRQVIDYFAQNRDLKVLGVTATPDRADEEALGKVFNSVAFDYQINAGIEGGWLVPIKQHFVYVQDLDFSQCRTTAGDLNGADLAKVMESEEMLHKIVSPVLEIAGGRKTLVFAASVAHAERMAEICNRHRSGCAEIIHGKTDRELRRDILKRYSRGDFQFLFNCMIATEGFDEPTVEVVAIARPTKSRALYAQMVGRGTRALPGVVDGFNNGVDRRAAIASSDKPSLEVLDFVGNSGKHKLISTADILGGNYDDAVVERARKTAAKKGEASDMLEELEAARKAIEDAERQRRKGVIATAKFGTKIVDPFALFDLAPVREPGWHKGRKPTEKQLAALRKFGVADKELSGMSFTKATQLLDTLVQRVKDRKCTVKQAMLLSKYGYDTNSTFEQASALIDAVAKNGWKRPEAVNV